jgi:NAD(P)-dependent dehydrogenase (short-subunit alcohol dehydrogenase family)
MTGATSGLGKVSALRTASQGNHLVVLARNAQKATSLHSEFKQLYPESTGTITIIEADLNSLASIHNACTQITKAYPVIDQLINNAGIMNFEPRTTPDGIEETFQVNLLAPLLITHLLLPSLAQSAQAKIIITASGLHQGTIHFNNLEFKNEFSSFKVYRQSKLGVILLTRLLAPVLKPKGISIYAQHPGVVRTNLGNSAGWMARMVFLVMGKSPEKGAQTLNYLMETPKNQLQTGEYYAKQKVTQTTPESYNLASASQLLHELKKYLQPYLHETSVIFT